MNQCRIEGGERWGMEGGGGMCVLGRRRRGGRGEQRKRTKERERRRGWWGGYEEIGLRGVKTNGPSVQVKTWEKPQERTRDSSVVRVMLRMGEGGGGLVIGVVMFWLGLTGMGGRLLVLFQLSTEH